VGGRLLSGSLALVSRVLSVMVSASSGRGGGYLPGFRSCAGGCSFIGDVAGESCALWYSARATRGGRVCVTYLGFVLFAGVRVLAVVRSSVTWPAGPVLWVVSERATRGGRVCVTYLGCSNPVLRVVIDSSGGGGFLTVGDGGGVDAAGLSWMLRGRQRR